METVRNRRVWTEKNRDTQKNTDVRQVNEAEERDCRLSTIENIEKGLKIPLFDNIYSK